MNDVPAFSLLVAKEWRHLLRSPKLVAAALVVSGAVVLAVGLGLGEHRAFAAQQQAARALLAEEQTQTTDWMALRQRVFRDADPLQIFVAGVHRDVGRYAPIGPDSDERLIHSVYGDEPIFALFRTFDLAFVVTVVLSLFAIVFTYDAISGEREAGTLRLLSAYAVPRGMLVGAKALGLWLALLLPIALAGLLGLAIVVGSGVALDGATSARLAVFAAAALLYLSFWVALGVAVSTFVRRSATAFLALLAVWVATVLVLPRAALVAAVGAVPVPSAAEIEARRQGFEARAWEESLRAMSERWETRNAATRGLDEAARRAYEDANLWTWMQEDDAARRATETAIRENADRLRETARLQAAAQRRAALGAARLSPAATFELAAVAAAGTGLDLPERWERALGDYQRDWTAWHQDASGEGGMNHVVRRGGGGGGWFENTPKPVDLADMPAFVPPPATATAALAAVPMELGLLALETILAFALAWVGMLRYDVR